MTELKKIVDFLDAELSIASIKDYPGAMNGLQLQNNGKVERIFSAVDASLAVIEAAAAKGGGLLLVHHGMLWNGVQSLTGVFYRKIKAAIDGNLAIYSAHLPLDGHPIHGNNILLAQAIGLQEIYPILHKDNWPMGVCGKWQGSRNDLIANLSALLKREITVCPSGPDEIENIAIITGGAGSQVGKIADLAIDTFLTGEGTHASYIEAEERGINAIYAGHYATETFGVKSLSRFLSEKFHLDSHFLQQAGGL